MFIIKIFSKLGLEGKVLNQITFTPKSVAETKFNDKKLKDFLLWLGTSHGCCDGQNSNMAINEPSPFIISYPWERAGPVNMMKYHFCDYFMLYGKSDLEEIKLLISWLQSSEKVDYPGNLITWAFKSGSRLNQTKCERDSR